MILHLRYRSVCRYAHSGRSFFCRFPRICCQHVQCLFSMGYNTTAAACPCSHPVKIQASQQTLPHYITSLFNIQPTILPEYVLFFIVFSQNTCFFPLLLYALTKESGRERKPKMVYNFSLQMLCCSKIDPENQSTNRKDIYYVNWKNRLFWE